MGAFALFPVALLMLFLGVQMQFSQQSTMVPGAGLTGHINNKASVIAEEAQLFAGACKNAALASPGLISSSLVVTLPSGANLPSGAICMTEANPTGAGRVVYGYMPTVSGAAGRIMSDTENNAAWYVVRVAGQASNLSGGPSLVVPASIPVGSIVDSILVNP